MRRSEIYWADLGPASGSRPAKRRPVLVIQAEPYNQSRLATALTAAITSNTALATMPGNVFLPAAASGLPRDSVVNITALVTLNKTDLSDFAGQLSPGLMHEVDNGLRRVLALPGGVRGEPAGRQVREGGVLQVGVDLLDDRVAAVGLVGGHGVRVGCWW